MAPAFNEGHVKYLVVGGYAVSMHAEPRATKDLDILVGADAENSEAVYAALAKFGARVEGLTAKDFTDLDSLFRMGRVHSSPCNRRRIARTRRRTK